MNSFTGPPTSRNNHHSEHASAPYLPSRDIRSGEHVVQFYEHEEGLISSVASFIGAGLGGGDAAIILATKAHCDAFDMRLMTHGFSVAALKARKQLILVDAAELVSRFVTNGTVDEKGFSKFLADLLGQATNAGRPAHVFGEVVSLLWQEGNIQGAVRIEEIWNGLSAEFPVDRLCAYPMSCMQGSARASDFVRVCKEHSHVIPAENYTSKRSMDERLRHISVLQQQAASLETDSLARRAAEADATEQRATLMMAISMAELGTWEFEMTTNRLTCSSLCKAILGLKSFDAANYECLTESVHPEDQARVKSILNSAIADAKGCFQEFRVVDSSGEERFVKLTARYSLQNGGRMVGFAKDVTASKTNPQNKQSQEKQCSQN